MTPPKSPCTWPEGACACYMAQEAKPEDHAGRVWMHCEQGLSFSKASMARFMIFCLGNKVKIGSVDAFNPKFAGCMVMAAVRLRPDQFEAFEAATGGKLRKPPVISLNSGAQS